MPGWLTKALLKLHALAKREQLDRDLDDELAFHLAQRERQIREAGTDRQEARYAARRQFGNATSIKERSRANWTFGAFETLWQDLRYGARMLRRNPGFTLTAILTLALGIGANTAIFSVVYAVLLRPLPFKDPSRLVRLTEYSPGKVDEAGVPYPDYLEWKKQNTVFDEMAAYYDIDASNDIVLGAPSSAQRAGFSIVTSSFFQTLGVQPEMGRAFRDTEDQAGSGKLFVASDALWRSSFGSDPAAIGKSFVLDGENYTLAGVMPPDFQFPRGRDVWLSAGSLRVREQQDRISHPYHILGRLRPGMDIHAAQQQMDAIAQQLGRIYPATNSGWRVRAIPLIDEFVANVRPSLLVLLGAVFFIFLIACANVINIMLARASTRQYEFAVRATIGAGRSRLLRQNLTETFLIVALSVTAALLLANWGLNAVISLTGIHIPRVQTFHWNAAIFVFTAGIAAVTTILVGIVPVLQISSGEVLPTLREGQKSSSTSPRTQHLRNVLVISEVAIAILLLSGAGLMLKSFLALNAVDPGFNPHHLITMKIALPGTQYTKSDQTAAFLDRLLERLRALPDVKAASAISTLPLSGESNWGSFGIVGQPFPDWSQAPSADGRSVSADYFRTMDIPLLRGREFRERDAQDVFQAVIINEAMAKRFFPGVDPIGHHLANLDERPRAREVIGIVANVKSFGLEGESKPEMYTLYHGWWYMNLVLRTSQPVANIISTVKEQVAALDKGVAVYQVATAEDLMARSVTPERFNSTMLAIFAALALALAVVGIYGLLSFGVTRRTGEIGIRMALGAQRDTILRHILSEGARLIFTGVAIGVAASFVLTRLMRSLLFGVGPTDVPTFVAACLLLIFVALVACYIPARRAMRVDPIVALRYE
jgi:predicted permease